MWQTCSKGGDLPAGPHPPAPAEVHSRVTDTVGPGARKQSALSSEKRTGVHAAMAWSILSQPSVHQSSETGQNTDTLLTHPVPLWKPGPSTPAHEDPATQTYCPERTQTQKAAAQVTSQSGAAARTVHGEALPGNSACAQLPAKGPALSLCQESATQLTGKAVATEDGEAEGSCQTQETHLLSSPHTLQQRAGG